MAERTATGSRGARDGPSRRVGTLVVLTILIVAFGLRLGAGLWLQKTQGAEATGDLGDSRGYRNIADNLVAGRGLVMTDLEVGPSPRYADRMPGYPLILSALQAVFGENTVSLLVLQSLVGAATAWLAWRLGRELCSPLAGYLAAAGVAVATWQVAFAAVTLTECWSAALLTATMLCVALAVRRGRAAWAATAGLAGAALAYVHPEYLGLPAAMLAVALAAPGRRRWLRYWILGTVVLVAAMGPWWGRNASVFGRFVPTTTRLGVSLYDGVRPDATGGSDMEFESRLAPETAGRDELAYDAMFREMSWRTIRDEPGRVARLAWSKFCRTWSAVAGRDRGAMIHWASMATFVPMMGGAILAVGLMWRRRLLAAMAAPVVYVTLVHLVMVGSIRYRVPVEPLMWVLAGVAGAWVAEDRPATGCGLRAAGTADGDNHSDEGRQARATGSE